MFHRSARPTSWAFPLFVLAVLFLAATAGLTLTVMDVWSA